MPQPIAQMATALRIQCGRGLAPDSGVSVKEAPTEPAPSGASTLPQV
ncbi:hypothetical protein C4J87_1426 [Pseudomonas sp. R1-43-08]|nr:hypothetical protein C4J87_1426 [Pseudomonas sp. R1-43-08]